MKNKHLFTPPRKFILPWILCLIFFASTILVSYKAGYIDKLLVRVGFADEKVNTNYTLMSWERSLSQLNIDSDVVFFGDSITNGCDYQSYFPNAKIVNLGLSGDTIVQMQSRISMIESVTPETIFIMAGINSLNKGFDNTVNQYHALLSSISENNINAKIIVISTLPISKSKESGTLTNKNIVKLNSEMEKFCSENGIVFVNVYDYYSVDGYMNPELTKDGVHLHQESYEFIINAIRDYVEEH